MAKAAKEGIGGAIRRNCMCNLCCRLNQTGRLALPVMGLGMTARSFVRQTQLDSPSLHRSIR